MADLFRDFWWLLFPMSAMALTGFRAWLKDRARRETMQALRELAESGREPPAYLLAQLQR
ncbi:hypothetical protein [Caulobacter sp.]|uniref:hypothetical protein n=1 Tax=Caulobacter sp. TaxID=78 RepID=UPI001B1BEC3E|nr:hypothetical protein [Caulobacter sp.]MBO9544493.1 hypothetical protein [Caulobacter sp.]